MKKFIILLLGMLMTSGAFSQVFTYRYNPYTGMNKDQLELALEQAHKMKRNGMIWTGVGTGMLVGGGIMMPDGIQGLTGDGTYDALNFGAGLGIMTLSGFPLGYGLYAWIAGNERANMIEIELLAFDKGKLKLEPTKNGIGLVYKF